jgi:hypothetical protein
MTTLSIQTAAERIAEAEQGLADAEQRREVAAAKVVQLLGRLESISARRAQIRVDLEAGVLSDREAGGLIALASEDECDLRELLNQAEKTARSADPISERQVLAAAKKALDHAQGVARVEALRTHVLKAEEALVSALGLAGEALRQAGLPVGLRSVWMPTNNMLRAVAHSV